MPASTSPPQAHVDRPAPPPPAFDVCGAWYKVILDHFEIYGKDFDVGKLGTDGDGLL